MPCYGTEADHCCYLNGQPCPYIVENITDDEGRFRRWGCGLRAELGSWDAVIASDRYQNDVAPTWESINKPKNYCKVWPDNISDFNCSCMDSI